VSLAYPHRSRLLACSIERRTVPAHSGRISPTINARQSAYRCLWTSLNTRTERLQSTGRFPPIFTNVRGCNTRRYHTHTSPTSQAANPSRSCHRCHGSTSSHECGAGRLLSSVSLSLSRSSGYSSYGYDE